MPMRAIDPFSFIARSRMEAAATHAVVLDHSNVWHGAQAQGRDPVLQIPLLRIHTPHLLKQLTRRVRVELTVGVVVSSRTDHNAFAHARMRRDASAFNMELLTLARDPFTNTEVGVDELAIEAGERFLELPYRNVEHLTIASGDHAFMRLADAALRAGKTVSVFSFASALGGHTRDWYQQHGVEVVLLDGQYDRITFVEGGRYPRR